MISLATSRVLSDFVSEASYLIPYQLEAEVTDLYLMLF